ncbi:hypothetical protein C1H46_035462 [Malus baccata]|uniref:RDRP3-5 N-terminal domain-containing protein n=1 Tax=Malus baccata TaxID=106549 RepID=A0A540KXN4_MALBA|nr:hypothetical protein C1H46_035462 [Malus baccata]
MDHPHNYGSKRSYTEIADVGFDEPVLSNPDASSLCYSQLPTSAIRTLSQPRLAAAATAGDDFPETQLHVPLPLPVEQKLNSICEERDQQQPGADLRRRLGLLGEEKALELLGKIYNSKNIQNLSGYIGFWLRQERYQCAPRSRSRSPSPSPSKPGPAASPLLHSPSSASQITPGRQGSTSGGQKQLDSYFSASPSKSAPSRHESDEGLTSLRTRLNTLQSARWSEPSSLLSPWESYYLDALWYQEMSDVVENNKPPAT